MVKKKFDYQLIDKNIIKILNLEKQEVLLNPENRLKSLLKNPKPLKYKGRRQKFW